MKRYLPLILFSLMLFSASALAQTSAGTSALDAVWNQIATNHPEIAIQELSKRSGSNVDALRARGFAHLALGDWESALNDWIAVVQQDPSVPNLSMLSTVSSHTDAASQCITLYEELLRDNTAVNTQSILSIQGSLQSLYLATDQPKKAAELTRPLGYVTEGWTVAGPFGRYGSSDLDEPFGPETQPMSLPYDGWIGNISPVPGRMLIDGELRFTRFLQPDKGIAYAWTAFQSQNGGQAHLTVETTDSVVVWLNGRRVLRKALLELDLSPAVSVPVTLRPGTNTIRVKVLKQAGLWNFRLALRHPDGTACPISRPATIPSLTPVLLGGEIPDRLPLLTSDESGGDTLVDSLLRTYQGLLTGDIQEARRTAESTLESHPDFALVHRLLGELDNAEAIYRLGDDGFLNSRAAREFQKAVDLLPEDAYSQAQNLEQLRDRDQVDAALEAIARLRRDLPNVAADPRVLEQSVKAFRDKGFLTEARISAEQLTTQLPSLPDGWLELAGIMDEIGVPCDGVDILRKGHESNPGDRALLNRYLDALEKCGLTEEAITLLTNRLDAHPNDINRLYRLCEFQMRNGQIDSARDLLNGVLAQYPDLVRPRELLLQIDTASLPYQATPDAGEKNVTPPALEDARAQVAGLLKRRPWNPDYQSLSRLLAGDPITGSQSAAPFYAPYLVRYEDLSPDTQTSPDLDSSDSEFLLDSLITRIHPDGTVTEMTHYIVRLLKPEGREKWAEVDIPSSNSELLWARTILEDGTVYEAEAPTDLGGRKVLSMYGLEPGCVVDIAYTESRRGDFDPGRNGYSGTFYFGQTNDFVHRSRWVVTAEDGTKMNWIANPQDFAPDINEDGGDKTYIWQREDIPGVRNESRRPSTDEIVPTVKITTWPNWLRAVRVIQTHSLGRDGMEPLLDDTATELASRADTAAEKLAVVYDFINKNVEDGDGGETAAETILLRKGSAFDKTTLARALLHRMGIESQVAWWLTSDPFSTVPDLPGPSRFADPILRVPVTTDLTGVSELGAASLKLVPAVWLDFTSRYLAPGEVSDPGRGPLALVDDIRGFHFEAVQSVTLPGGWASRDYRIRLESEGAVIAEGSITYCGDFKNVILERETDRSSLDQLIDFQVTDAVPGIQADEKELLTDGPLSNPVLTFHGPVGSFFTDTESGRSFSPLPDRTRLSELIREPTRTLDYLARGLVSYRPTTITYTLADPSWTWSEIPEDVVEITQFGVFALSYSVVDNTLTVRRSVYVPSQRITPGR